MPQTIFVNNYSLLANIVFSFKDDWLIVGGQFFLYEKKSVIYYLTIKKLFCKED